MNFAKNRKRLKIKQKNDFGKEKNKIWYGQIDPIHRIIINFCSDEGKNLNIAIYLESFLCPNPEKQTLNVDNVLAVLLKVDKI